MSYRQISKPELDKILLDHAEWLRDSSKGQRADLTMADLTGANLTGANLTWADLTMADLTGAGLLIFQFQKHQAFFTLDGTLRIGCECMPISEWVLGYEEIGKKHGYSDLEIEAYGDFIKLCLKVFEKKAGAPSGRLKGDG